MNDMRKLMEAVAPLFEGPDELNKMLAKFEQTCAEEYRCYGDVNAARVDALLKSGEGTGAAAEEMINSMSTQDGGEAPDIVYDVARDMLDDYMAEHGDMGAAMAQYEDVEQVNENISSEIEKLHAVMDHLDRLSAYAKKVVRQIDDGEAERLEAYGAFDFGKSSNKYDNTLESFIAELESGRYDDE